MLEVVDIYKSYPNEAPLFQDVSIKFKERAVTAIFGPSGSGKSTLLNLISGLDKPSKGEVICDGKNIYGLNDKDLLAWRRNHVGYVWQDAGLLNELTVLDNILIVMKLLSIKRSQRLSICSELLSLVGLSDLGSKKPDTLSRGQKQRVSLARSLALNPRFILCDEPTGNLDYENSIDVFKLLNSICNEFDMTVILATHDLDSLPFVDSVFNIKNRKVIEEK